MEPVTVIGAGLAGSECAWQLARRGIPVTLREMKPEKMTPAHVTPWFAELCCSNSLRGAGLENAVGLLKEELRRLDSLILRCKTGITRVALNQLEYCEVIHRTLLLHLDSGKVLESSGSLDELSRQLAPYGCFYLSLIHISEPTRH